MARYLEQHGTRATPQDEPMRPDQVANSAGGYSWAVDDWTRLRRFLILGSEGGSFYASERDLTKGNVDAVHRLVASDGVKLVDEVVAVSHGGKAPKNDPALFALACAISLGDKATKRAAAEALPRVARIGTHLYHFVAYAETMRGWGRTLRWAVSNWYDQKPEQLALQAVKYRQRDGWSHRDLLRLAHPKATAELAPIMDWITHRQSADPRTPIEAVPADAAAMLQGFENAQRSWSPEETAKLVREYGLPREALLPEHLTDPEVWRALLDGGMPLTALTRNLANMTRLGVLEGDYRTLVVSQLADADAIHKARLHPLALLNAMVTYASGKGLRGSNTWTPVAAVTDALNDAFYLAFDNVPKTGKRHLLALDISGSMDWSTLAGSALTPRVASAAMALVTLHAEDDCDVVAFSHGLTPVGMSRRQRLDDVLSTIDRMQMGGTDCALPMLWASQGNRGYDAFVVYTDSETWAGRVHPKQALDAYRQQTGIDARLAVVGMVANEFTIADPTDAGMLDVVGFDASAPAVMGEFFAGRL